MRIGLHCGEAEQAGDGFVGLDVHRASRICQAAHGGQVLASEEAAAGLGVRSRSSGRSTSAGCASRSGSSSSSPTICPPSSRRSAALARTAAASRQ